MAADDDLALIRALQGGDDGALDRIMARHREPLFRFVFRQVNHETDARDILQETFVRVYLHRQQFRPRATFQSWLYRIAGNLCHDHFRRRGRRSEVPLDQPSRDGTEGGPGTWERTLAADAPGPADETAEAERAARLRDAIGQLPDKLREALVLFELEGLSQLECARILQTTPKAVESRVARARWVLAARLRRVLG